VNSVENGREHISISSKVPSKLKNELPGQLMKLNITVVSWNLCEKPPSDNDCNILLKQQLDSDIVVIGVQELEDIRPRRNEGRRSVRWRQILKNIFDMQYKSVSRHKMGGLQINVFVKKSCKRLVTDARVIEVACGVGNVLTNKGGLCVLLKIKGNNVALINAHLAAHQNKVSARNADYHRIMENIYTNVKSSETVTSFSSAAKHRVHKKRPRMAEDLKESPIDCIIFFGDLNYRVDLPRLELEEFYLAWRQQVGESIPGTKHILPAIPSLTSSLRSLLSFDQLLRERVQGRAFDGFREGPITFPPTFKYDVDSIELDSSSKARCPAWTDRVLYTAGRHVNPFLRYCKSNEDDSDNDMDNDLRFESVSSIIINPTQKPRTEVEDTRESGLSLTLKRYYSVELRSSDHRPVCAEFSLSLTSDINDNT